MILYIGIHVFFLAWIIINRLFLPSLPKQPKLITEPLVSVLVPMRNEERNVATLIKSLKGATYRHVEFIILNDQSTDGTQQLLTQEIAGDPRFKIIMGKELPKDWVGKVHACHQLQQEASGEYLLFVDADVRFRPKAIEQSLALLQRKKAQLLTGFPAFDVSPFLSKLLVPMLHFLVLFHLPIFLANHTKFKAATAANGMWMMFEATSYRKMGGHATVYDSLVEDVHIAREIKEHGYKVVLANITMSVKCRMYDTNAEVWEGFLKNSYAGIGRSPVMAFFLILFYFIFYILPPFLAIYGLGNGFYVWAVPFALTVAQRWYIDMVTNQRWYLAFLIPFQALAMLAVLTQSMRKSFKNQSYSWKGRHYS
ncbi:glycosyl transferase, family 2 [Planococcus donghaensis MPA1U2]|uniref:Glycosyl transferase, family 2 n=1 Tax=Planococcus donghaensis MPA1U2 TaxID=933115 RepID=E7RJH6_9BACL|nr:glycosyltransferase family 2 protein [Planococcus donghaensis]EGA88818.1 glycosyl transferase, family 2 [Planococcus donghaensis MPA1U2]